MLSYTIAENGTYFMAACFPAYQPLLRGTKGFSYITRFLSKTSQTVRSSRVIKGSSSSEALRNSTPKRVRAFESLLLSNVSRDVRSSDDNKLPVTVEELERGAQRSSSGYAPDALAIESLGPSRPYTGLASASVKRERQ